MISLASARKLKDADLTWTPALHDFFAIPDRGMDERVFVISDMLVNVETVQGMPMIQVQGASEWALDTLATLESVWLPNEEQLRTALEAALINTGRPEIIFSSGLSEVAASLEDVFVAATGFRHGPLEPAARH